MPYDASQDRSPKGNPTTPFQARKGYAVVPNDNQDLAPYAKALYVGVAGDLKIIPVDNRDQDPVVLPNHPVGYCSWEVRRVLATGTGASGIVAMHD